MKAEEKASVKAKEEQSKVDANDMRLKAMESLRENKKRRSEEQDEKHSTCK